MVWVSWVVGVVRGGLLCCIERVVLEFRGVVILFMYIGGDRVVLEWIGFF